MIPSPYILTSRVTAAAQRTLSSLSCIRIIIFLFCACITYRVHDSMDMLRLVLVYKKDWGGGAFVSPSG